MTTCADALIESLRLRGVDTVFGIPGVHTVALYRAIAAAGIRHVTPRHEQGAAFMADGFARASGRPGVCALISGPGVTNAVTPLAQAFSDSVPVLAVSSVSRQVELGMGRGTLHELPSQHALMTQCTAFSHSLTDCAQLDEVLERAFTRFATERPRPVHLEVPLDLLDRPAARPAPPAPARARPGADPAAVAAAQALLARSARPVLVVGGGAVEAGPAVVALAERLDAPVVLTVAAKGVVPADHPLCVGPMLTRPAAQALVTDADVVLAVGTELGQTDTWLAGRDLPLSGALIRVDVDPAQLTRNARPTVALVADARLALEALAATASEEPRPRRDQPGAARVADVRAAISRDTPASAARHLRVLEVLRRVLPPDTVVTGDSTQLVYAGNWAFPTSRPRTWLTSTTGYGTLGYALPAAIGARAALPDRPVVAIAGDGGLLYTLPELACAVAEGLPVVVVVWSNDGYAEIRDAMRARQIPPLGTDWPTPDLVTIARGFGAGAARPRDAAELEQVLGEALAGTRPYLVEIRESDF